MRVLLVDDNPDQLGMLSALIGSLGHEVRTSTRGPLALELAQRFKPEIAFVDLGLPDIDGHELGRALKNELPELRLYALTGRGESQAREKSFQAGFSDHLMKPVEFSIVESLLKPRAL